MMVGKESKLQEPEHGNHPLDAAKSTHEKREEVFRARRLPAHQKNGTQESSNKEMSVFPKQSARPADGRRNLGGRPKDHREGRFSGHQIQKRASQPTHDGQAPNRGDAVTAAGKRSPDRPLKDPPRQRPRSNIKHVRCRELQDGETIQELWWRSEINPIPLALEQSIVKDILPYGKREMGMLREKSKNHVKRIQGIGKKHGINLSTLCSLRRHHIKKHHPFRSMPQLRLGEIENINESARIFESVIENFLRNKRVDYFTEGEQKRSQNPVTPDFLLKQPVLLKSFRLEEEIIDNDGGKELRKKVFHEQQIHWIEVKMFYGASTIDPDGKSAVGNVLNTAEKYTRLHGPGAMIFFQGYGDALGQQLLERGVVPLDCCSCDNVNHRRVLQHQRTWCADKSGLILP